LGLFLGVLILFLNTNKSFADDFITNATDYSYTPEYNIENYCDNHSALRAIQPFTIPSNFPSGYKLDKVGFYAFAFRSGSFPYNFANDFRLIISSQNPVNFNGDYNAFAPYILADIDHFELYYSYNYISPPTEDIYKQIDLSSYNIQLIPGQTYYFMLGSTLTDPGSGYFGCVLGIFFGPSDYDRNLILSGYGSNDVLYPSSSYFTPNFGASKIKLDLYYTASTPQPFVNIIKPQNNEVITNQNYPLNFFGVDYFLPDAATGTTATFYLNYSNLDETINHEEQFYLPIDDYTISTSTQFYFGKTYYLPNGNYKARAIFQYQLAGTTTQAIIYSDEVYFTINEAGGISYGTSTTSTIPIPNFEDICTAPPGGFLDYPTQNITYALCKVFSYLFIPNQEQQQHIQNRFSSFQDIIKSKPPLGYFYKIKDALNQNITAGNATTTQVLNTSTTQAFSAVFSPLKTGLNWVLWLAAGSWVFIKIKNLNI